LLPPLNATRVKIASGDRGIAQTIRYMCGAVMGNEGMASAEIRRKALEIVRPIASRDQQGEIAALLQWVKTKIAFRGEYKETIQTPLVTLQLAAGDCDDQAALLGAFLGALGYQTRFRTVAADPTAPWAYSHVFVEVFHRKSGQWIALDSTVPASYPGWTPPRIFRSQAWRTMGDNSSAAGDNSQTQPPFTPGQQLIREFALPFVQAAASRIQYGGAPPKPTASLSLTTQTIGGISPVWVFVGGGAVLLGIAWAFGSTG
jgi:hypothetical protein